MQPEKNKQGVDRREMIAASVAIAAADPALLGTVAKTTLPVATKITHSAARIYSTTDTLGKRSWRRDQVPIVLFMIKQ